MMDGRVMIVAKPVASEKGTDSYLTAKDAEFFKTRGELDKAIKLYKQAIDLDPSNPFNHYALANIHLNGGEGFVSAGYEYSLAWKYKQQFSSRNDELDFYNDYIAYLIDTSRNDRLNAVRNLERAIQVYEASRKISAHFGITTNSAIAHALLSREQERTASGPQKRKKQEELLDKAKSLVEKSGNLRRNDYRYHRAAVMVNNEIFTSLYYQNVMSEEGQRLKVAILEHGNLYRSLKPSTEMPDSEVEYILNKFR